MPDQRGGGSGEVDGVDAVVFNKDPIVGGLKIVQAKKYTRVLGGNHIRELVGAMD